MLWLSARYAVSAKAPFANLLFAALVFLAAKTETQADESAATTDASASITSVAGQESIGPPEIYARVALVRSELDRIRAVMGRPENLQSEIGVEGAAPREVYFQALTLFRKSERLCFEQTHERASPPSVPDGEITPADVGEMVDAALERIRLVRNDIGIPQDLPTPELDPQKTPNDVFRSIVQANRQLNLLLDNRVSPSDVYEQVTLGISYAARILSHFEAADRYPLAPEFESKKRPADVYRRSLEIFEQLRSIADQSGLEMLKLTVNDEIIEQATPSDVYDIVSLLVSELAYVHSHVPDAKPPRNVVFPGRKFPSHVYQRAGILKAQLSELERLSKDAPDWLGNTAKRTDDNQ